MRFTLFTLLLLTACTATPPDLHEQATREIIAADKAMSARAMQEGFYKTLLLYADENVVNPREGQLPVIGKQALTADWTGKTDVTTLSWEPFKAEAAKSGDWGYTLGNWKLTQPDTVLYGNYYTIWKKQPDGAWKFVVDGGNNTPAPTQHE